MFKKGRKREAKGLAVVYFIIGLIILLIILAVIYFALVELDYSDRIKDPDATIRSYVEMTPDPNAFALEDDMDGFEPDLEETELDVDLTVATNTPTPTPTPTPEPTPTPTPTPEPTPTPTPIPPTMLSQPKTSGFSLPTTLAANCQAAITKCTVSVGDNNRCMYLAGYAFINDAAFDGSKVQSFLIVTQSKTNQMMAYQLTMRPGVSGDPHAGALCQNATSTDFEVCFDVGQLYTDDMYKLGIVIGYKPQGRRKASYSYYAFPSDVTFTVMGGQVTEPVPVAGAQGDATVQTYTGMPNPTLNTGFDTSEPDDLAPEPTAAGYNPALAGATQQPTIDNAQEVLQDTEAIQEQIYQNQMGVG